MRTTSEVIVCIITSYRKVMGSAHSLKCFSLQRISLILHFFLFHNVLFLHLGWKSLASITRTVNLNSRSCLLQWQKSPECNNPGWVFSCPSLRAFTTQCALPSVDWDGLSFREKGFNASWKCDSFKICPVRPQNHEWFWKNAVAVPLIHCLFQSGTTVCCAQFPTNWLMWKASQENLCSTPFCTFHDPRSSITAQMGKIFFPFCSSIYFFCNLHYYWVACMLFTSFYSL